MQLHFCKSCDNKKATPLRSGFSALKLKKSNKLRTRSLDKERISAIVKNFKCDGCIL